MRNAHRILVGKSSEKVLGCNLEVSIKENVNAGCEGMDWIHMNGTG
jgi:hypothetical protein